MKVKRNRIYWYEEKKSGKLKPCIVVSNNKGNRYSSLVLIVPMGKEENEEESVAQLEEGKYAYCSRLHLAEKRQIKKFERELTEREVNSLNEALNFTLDLHSDQPSDLRGRVAIVELAPKSGNEKSHFLRGERPCIIVTSDKVDSSMVIVVCGSSKEPSLPTHLRRGNTTFMCETLMLVDKSKIVSISSTELPSSFLASINEGVATALGLDASV